MDKLEQLGSQLSQITLYDIKSMYNQAKNMVLNVTEMEAKVREATNDDPWGASSTLMQEIAQGTFNFTQFNEIMPCIYSRFMDKEARQWREIYKALQLLEYIIKHGSERVVDDARSHLSTIKMLRNFHYIDEKGKDQGINVRNRAKELAELLSDVDKIRAERRKAKANRNKYVGTGNDGMSFSSGGGRYGGFGNYSGGGGGSSYDRDYGGYDGGSSSSGFRDDQGNKKFEEYNAGDDEIPPRRSNSVHMGGSSSQASGSAYGSGASQSREAQKQEKVVDLLGFNDDDILSGGSSATPTAAGLNKALPAVSSNPLDADDDEFADFQAAPAPVQASAPVTAASPPPAAKPNVFDVLGSAPPTSTSSFSQPAAQTQRVAQPMQPVQAGANLFGGSTFSPMSPGANRQSFSSPLQSPTYGTSSFMTPTTSAPGPRPALSTTSSTASASQNKPATTSAGFDDLWNLSLGSSSKPASGTAAGAKSIKDLEKEKMQAGIWGGQTQSGSKAPQMGSGLGSLGTTSGASTNANASAGGFDDLLL